MNLLLVVFFLQPLTCNFCCHLPVVFVLNVAVLYCCLFLPWPQLVNFVYFVILVAVSFGFISFVRRKSTLSQAFFNKRYFSSLRCVFSFATFFQLESSSFAFRTFSAKRKTQRRAPPLR
jgi:hypothetical protein